MLWILSFWHVGSASFWKMKSCFHEDAWRFFSFFSLRLSFLISYDENIMISYDKIRIPFEISWITFLENCVSRDTKLTYNWQKCFVWRREVILSDEVPGLHFTAPLSFKFCCIKMIGWSMGLDDGWFCALSVVLEDVLLIADERSTDLPESLTRKCWVHWCVSENVSIMVCWKDGSITKKFRWDCMSRVLRCGVSTDRECIKNGTIKFKQSYIQCNIWSISLQHMTNSSDT